MNISQLEYLVSAIHLGSYSRAAKEQFVTPQAVSKAIRTLESELGLKLIVSSGKTISPTDVGVANCRRGRSGYPPCRQNRLNRFLV